jgi:hypothetical protein
MEVATLYVVSLLFFEAAFQTVVVVVVAGVVVAGKYFVGLSAAAVMETMFDNPVALGTVSVIQSLLRS